MLQIDSLCPWGLKVLAYTSHNNWWLVYLNRTTTKDKSDALHWWFQFVCICQVSVATWCNTLQLWDSQRFFHKSWTCTSSSSIGRSIQKLICSQPTKLNEFLSTLHSSITHKHTHTHTHSQPVPLETFQLYVSRGLGQMGIARPALVATSSSIAKHFRFSKWSPKSIVIWIYLPLIHRAWYMPHFGGFWTNHFQVFVGDQLGHLTPDLWHIHGKIIIFRHPKLSAR